MCCVAHACLMGNWTRSYVLRIVLIKFYVASVKHKTEIDKSYFLDTISVLLLLLRFVVSTLLLSEIPINWYQILTLEKSCLLKTHEESRWTYKIRLYKLIYLLKISVNFLYNGWNTMCKRTLHMFFWRIK